MLIFAGLHSRAAIPTSIVTVTIDVSTPGTLKQLLVDSDTRPENLVLTGTLNSADLSYIAQAQGTIGSVKALDMSAVRFDYDDGLYNSISGSDGSGIGLGTLTRQFILSTTCRNDTTSTGNGLGGGKTTIKHYSNNLSGLFCNNSTLESVILPKSLQGIGSFIFYGSSVSSVALPDAIAEIPEYAFSATANLAEFNSPASISRIGKAAFSNSSVKYFRSGSIVEVGELAFSDSEIERFDFSQIKEIGNSAFKNTPGLSGSLSLPTVRILGESCFRGTGFSSVTLGEQIDSIPCEAFYGSNLSAAKLPSGIKYIGESAFYNCNADFSINVPESVTFIGQNAFPVEWLYNQPTDGGVWYFGQVAYKYDSRLAGVETLQLKSGIKAISPGFASDALRSTLKTLLLPAGIESIGQCYDPEKEIAQWRKSCFYECEKLESVNLPEGLLTIGDGAFFRCARLQITQWPVSLRSIGQTAFLGCESLYSVTLGENLTHLGGQAFQDCDNISDVKLYSTILHTNGSPFYGGAIEKATIGANVTNVPYKMFDGCSALIKVVFEGGDATQPGLAFGESAFNGCVNLKIDRLPLRTVSVGKSAFESVSFGETFATNNIIEIGSSAFLNCKGMVSLDISSRLERCGAGAFSDIESLSEVYYNAPDLDLMADTYYNSPFARGSNFRATGITKVTIGPDVHTIPENLFNYHPNLVSLIFEPRSDQSRAGNPLMIDTRAFHQCNIQSLELPDVRTAIGELAFAGNTRLKTLRLGNGTENIDKQAFWQCHALVSVDIPSSVVSIGEETFYQYTSNGYPYQPQMQESYLHFRGTPEIGYHAFAQSVKVFVQQNMLQQYQTSGAGWNTLVPYAITSFTIDRDTAEVPVGGSITLKSTIAPDDYSGMDISWISSDPSIASVDNSGKITGIRDGKVVITASVAYLDGYSATCNLTVGHGAGVDEIDAESTYKILGIYNLNGVFVGDSTEHLMPGIYIIKKIGSVEKVIVK